MKNYRVTVNGCTYDVQVEEVSGFAAASAQAVAPAPVAAAAPAVAPATGGTEGNVKVTAPMPGTILDIKVNIGDSVSANQVVIVLEAMKMENEIVTPSAGKVSSINVSKGDTVNSGDILVTIQG